MNTRSAHPSEESAFASQRIVINERHYDYLKNEPNRFKENWSRWLILALGGDKDLDFVVKDFKCP